MKINAVFLKKDSSKNVNTTSVSRKLIFITAYLCFFAVIGTAVFILHKDSVCTQLNEFFSEYNLFIKEKSKPDVFTGLLYGQLFYIVAVAFFTFNILGKPFIYIISGLRISGISVIVSYLYYAYQIKGIEYALLVFLPGKLLQIFAVILTINLSTAFINQFISSRQGLKSDTGLNLIKLFLILLVLLLSVITDTITATAFSSLFEL